MDRLPLTANASGRISIAGLLALLTLAAGGYCGMEVGGVYWRRMKLADAVRREVGFAGQLTDEAIRRRVVAAIEEVGLPPGARDVRVTRTLAPRTLHVTVSYSDTADLVVTTRTLPMTVETRRTF